MNVDLLFQLYLHGRRVRQLVGTTHNEQMLSGTILWLVKEKERTVSELADLLSTTLSSVSEKLTQLEQTGLIQRIASAKDRRAQVVHLTSRGQTTLDEMVEVANNNCMIPLDKLTREESLIFETLLKKLL